MAKAPPPVPDITTRYRGNPGHVLAKAMEREALGTKECCVLMRCTYRGVVTIGLCDGSCRDRQAPAPPWAGRGETKVGVSSPRLMVGEASSSSLWGVSEEGGERKEWRGGKLGARKGGGGGGAGSRGCLAKVQGRDDGRHWTAWIAVGVDRALPLHPCSPVLRSMMDGGTDRGRR